MSKDCRLCESLQHTAFTCPRKPHKPMKRTRMNKMGKIGKKWAKTRAEWFRANPADAYRCYICGTLLTAEETTLDHIKSRGRHPELRFDMTNLAPCCWSCNTLKGSKDLEEL